MRKVLVICSACAAGVLLAADIAFKWDVSGRSVEEPTGETAAFVSFDSVVRASNASATAAETVRVPYRADFETGEADVSTFRPGMCIILR